MTMPKRGWSRPLARARSRTCLPGTLPVGESNSALNCRGTSKRFSRLKLRLTFRAGQSDCEALAALGATTRPDGTTVFGGHTGAETRHACALEGAGLESAFHDGSTWWSLRAGSGPR